MDLTKEAVAQQAAATGILVQDLQMENQHVGLGWTSELRTCMFSPREGAFFLLLGEEAPVFAPCPMSNGPSPCPGQSMGAVVRCCVGAEFEVPLRRFEGPCWFAATH